MRAILSALLGGALFGAGLALSGMTQADKVINFLDVSHAWDPSLAFVMVGAIAVHVVLFHFILRRSSPLFAERFGIPTRSDIDRRLVVGSGIFGVGWALGGYCPGPGLASLSSVAPNAIVFVLFLTVGILGFQWVDARRSVLRAESSS